MAGAGGSSGQIRPETVAMRVMYVLSGTALTNRMIVAAGGGGGTGGPQGSCVGGPVVTEENGGSTLGSNGTPETVVVQVVPVALERVKVPEEQEGLETLTAAAVEDGL